MGRLNWFNGFRVGLSVGIARYVDILETAEILVEPFAAMRFMLDGLFRCGPVGGTMLTSDMTIF